MPQQLNTKLWIVKMSTKLHSTSSESQSVRTRRELRLYIYINKINV
jgi:hypothetical protein